MITFQDKKILIIVAHGDDEVLNAGGLILGIADEAKCIDILIISKRYSRESNSFDLYKAKKSDKKNNYLSKTLGIHNITYWEASMHDDNLTVTDAKDVIELFLKNKSKTKVKYYDIVINHDYCDFNQTHRVVAEAGMIAFRTYSNQTPQLYMTHCCTMNSVINQLHFKMSFDPNFFYPITESTLQKKYNWLKYLYPDQITPYRNMSALKRMHDGYLGFRDFLELSEKFRIVFYLQTVK